ncbi:60S ribosomal protein L13 [Smittium mucronatum]|uniref:60S ribosomal protein L13 n=1 Tax=Smittium mucronatum TaxID=133383 RepID=A0A1R0GVA5_9FUNG|nr:60S ribosomal protein L13 [Smittium mucronatum]
MKHNNQLPNQHFRKEWQLRVKTWFDQPGRKLRRHRNRVAKAAKIAPRPTERLRPVVRCPTIKYNRKLRVGRGFTLDELKAAKISARYAQTIGIAVDFRRRNRSDESLNANVARLADYKSRLIVLPRAQSKRTPELISAYKSAVQLKGDLAPIANNVVVEEPRAITEEEKKVNAFYTLRQARANKRYRGVRDALAKARAEEEAQKVKK